MARVVAEAVVDYILSSLSERFLYGIQVNAEMKNVQENTFALSIEAEVNISPFAPIDPALLIHEAIERGFEVGKEELSRRGVKTRLWRFS
ncbi:MAG: DUF3194 domain-containing protein [Thermoprotei archaeon]|nr:DUF3194 domain-containing protein [Thermoprotei archaeon]